MAGGALDKPVATDAVGEVTELPLATRRAAETGCAFS